MITRSDNGAASALWDEDGRARLQRFLGAAGMIHTVLGPGAKARVPAAVIPRAQQVPDETLP